MPPSPTISPMRRHVIMDPSTLQYFAAVRRGTSARSRVLGDMITRSPIAHLVPHRTLLPSRGVRHSCSLRRTSMVACFSQLLSASSSTPEATYLVMAGWSSFISTSPYGLEAAADPSWWLASLIFDCCSSWSTCAFNCFCNTALFGAMVCAFFSFAFVALFLAALSSPSFRRSLAGSRLSKRWLLLALWSCSSKSGSSAT